MDTPPSRRNPGKTEEMRRLLLEEGLPASEVATHPAVLLSRRRVFSYAESQGLPTNPPCSPHSRREHQLLRALQVWDRALVLRIFSMSEPALRQVLDRIAHEEKFSTSPSQSQVVGG